MGFSLKGKRRRAAAIGAAVAVAAGAGIATAVVPSSAEAASGCTAAHLIVARASTELPGDGIIGTVAASIQATAGMSTSQEAVNYPALLTPYAPSVAAGDSAIKNQLTNYVQRCPDSKIVLMGYSQGANIVGDVLGGGGSNFSIDGILGINTPEVPPAADDVTSHVVAAIQMGDPRFLPGKSWDRGTNLVQTGLFPRNPNQSLQPFASRIRSYCDIGDPFCAAIGLDVLAHLDYTLLYGADATSFAVSQLHKVSIPVAKGS